MTYLALDLETVLDADLARRVFDWDSPDDAQIRASLRQRQLDKTKGRSDFLAPLWHRVVAVGLAAVNPSNGARKADARAGTDEADLVRYALEALAKRPRLVTFNGRGFDLPVLFHRAMIHGIPVTALVGPRDAKQWDTYGYRYGGPHLDVMDRLTNYGAGGSCGLDELATACGLPGKGDFTGADVEAAWTAGDLETIRTYVQSDAEQTLALGLRFARLAGEISPEIDLFAPLEVGP